MRLVPIPAGKFLMGSPPHEEGRSDEEKQHEVEITQPFYMCVFEVTQEEYEKVMGTLPPGSIPNLPGGFGPRGGALPKMKQVRSLFPVVNVSWHDAVEFCGKLTDSPEEKRTNRTYRLPTEAEWEYACRGGAATSEPFHFGKTISPEQANISRNPVGTATRPVGFYRQPNAFGLHDMHGNVWEWCQDFYDKDYYARSPKRDPENKDASSSHVVRGGSWNSGPPSVRSASRKDFPPDPGRPAVGFRVVMRTGERTP
jgi:formylglycine-generating enzyme required for sulfatase activity